MKYAPCGARVLVKPIEDPGVTAGGIIIPEQAKEPAMRGVVVAVGDGEYAPNGTHIPVTVEVGETVLFGKFAGNWLTINGVQMKVMKMTDIMLRIVCDTD